ncbi:MAG: hypothetical protein V3T55_08080 [Anaerolineales bacterium]
MATFPNDILPPPPFASLPSALFVGSLHEPGARWGSLQVGAAISLTVSGASVGPETVRSHPNGA